MIRLLVSLTLFGNGLTAGVMFSTAIGMVPMTLVLPYDRYIHTIQFLWPRYDPVMPILNAMTVSTGVALAFSAPETVSRRLFGAAAVLLMCVIAISVVKNVPINRYVMSLNPETPPPNWAEQDPRVGWRNWNLVRTLLGLLALSTNIAGAAALL